MESLLLGRLRQENFLSPGVPRQPGNIVRLHLNQTRDRQTDTETETEKESKRK